MHGCSHLSSEQLTCISLGQINPGLPCCKVFEKSGLPIKDGPLAQLVEQVVSPPLPTFYLFNFTYFFFLFFYLAESSRPLLTEMGGVSDVFFPSPLL